MNRQTIQGGWIEYREPTEVPEGLRRKVTSLSARGVKYANLPKDEEGNPIMDDQTSSDIDEMMQFMDDINDAAAIALINAWSFPEPITKEALLNLPAHIYRAIANHVQPLIPEMMPNFGVDGADDPKVVTAN